MTPLQSIFYIILFSIFLIKENPHCIQLRHSATGDIWLSSPESFHTTWFLHAESLSSRRATLKSQLQLGKKRTKMAVFFKYIKTISGLFHGILLGWIIANSFHPSKWSQRIYMLAKAEILCVELQNLLFLEGSFWLVFSTKTLVVFSVKSSTKVARGSSAGTDPYDWRFLWCWEHHKSLFHG